MATTKNSKYNAKRGDEVATPPDPLDFELLASEEGREFILLIGPDKVGKTSACLSFCMFWESMYPDNTVWYFDTENGVSKAARAFKKHPDFIENGFTLSNLKYYRCTSADELLLAFDAMRAQLKPGDLVIVESMARFWEYCQNLGYREIAQMDKSAYLEKLRERGNGRVKGSPIPEPDKFWDIVKEAHDSVVNFLSGASDIHVLLTSTTERPGRRENADRKDFREQHGIETGISGAPRLPYYPDSVLLLQREKGRVKGYVLGDRGAVTDASRKNFVVVDGTNFAWDWAEACRPELLGEEEEEEAAAS